MDRRLRMDADRLVGPPDHDRVRMIMNAIHRSEERPVEAVNSEPRQPVIARIGRLAPLAIAAAFVLVAAPILFLAASAPRASAPTSSQQQAAAIRSAFDAFDNVHLPELPLSARESLTKALAMASPDGVKSQTKALFEDGKRFAEQFIIPIPSALRRAPDRSKSPTDESPDSTSLNPMLNSSGEA